ncbi:MAG TPA: hypothetical protein VFZ08_01045 [Terriglobia bacterium]|nr:hypothetical protein [Terriglobia bacterium]
MRKPLLIALMVAIVMGAGLLTAAPRQFSAVKQVKRQQKLERQRLKNTEKIWKKSFRGRHIPRAERLAVKHQYQRQMRDLKVRQKDELQRMKDDERMQRTLSRHVWSGGAMIE